MSSLTYRRDPILQEFEGPRATSWWAGTLIAILVLLVLGALFRYDGAEAGSPHESVEVSTGIGS
jgi:hypothetical protein